MTSNIEELIQRFVDSVFSLKGERKRERKKKRKKIIIIITKQYPFKFSNYYYYLLRYFPSLLSTKISMQQHTKASVYFHVFFFSTLNSRDENK